MQRYWLCPTLQTLFDWRYANTALAVRLLKTQSITLCVCITPGIALSQNIARQCLLSHYVVLQTYPYRGVSHIYSPADMVCGVTCPVHFKWKWHVKFRQRDWTWTFMYVWYLVKRKQLQKSIRLAQNRLQVDFSHQAMLCQSCSMLILSPDSVFQGRRGNTKSSVGLALLYYFCLGWTGRHTEHLAELQEGWGMQRARIRSFIAQQRFCFQSLHTNTQGATVMYSPRLQDGCR